MSFFKGLYLLAMAAFVCFMTAVSVRADEASHLVQAQNWLNDFTQAEGRFIQKDADGAAVAGSFYLLKPGKIRFDYDKPNTLSVISDGTWLGVSDDGKTYQRYPISQTPIPLLMSKNGLRSDYNLVDDTNVLETIQLQFKQKSGPAEMTLIFIKEPFRLAGWVARDGQGSVVQIVLDRVEYNKVQNPALFVIPQNLRPTIGK